jgi:hypothetical protein
MYTRIKPGAMTQSERKMHNERLAELTRRHTTILTLTTMPLPAKLFLILLMMGSIGWAGAAYAIASADNCQTVTFLRIWTYVSATLVLIHIIIQIVLVVRLRPASMKLTTALIAYKHLVGLKINHNELRERY